MHFEQTADSDIVSTYQVSSVRDVEADAKAGSGPFSVETEARKFYRFCFHIGYLT